jgi:CheY-like chemotaxis protein
VEAKQPIRVLIVDDEERFRATTAAILTKRGYAVTAAGSGEQALEEIRQDGIDVVILDVKMPGMDGTQALREIKRLKPEVSVIMLTGQGTPDAALAALRDGAFDYLTKPCSIDLLARRINDALAQGQRVSEAEHRVRDLMVPLSSFSTIREDQSVAEAIEAILVSYNRTLATGSVHESIHRSILVLNPRHKVIGLVSFTDLLQGLFPRQLSEPSDDPSAETSSPPPPLPDSGTFTLMTRHLANRPIRELMSKVPLTIEADASLIEAVIRMLELKVRRLLVEDGNKIIGVIREQDLFFEIATIIRQQTG